MKRKILYSPGFGAGWATWNDSSLFEFLTTYQPIIDHIEANKGIFVGVSRYECKHPLLDQMKEDAIKKGLIKPDDHICVLGADDLKVKEVEGRFRISEYDGSESVVAETEEIWH